MPGTEPVSRDDLANALRLGENVATINETLRHISEDIGDIKDDNKSAAARREEIGNEVDNLKINVALLEQSQARSRWWGGAVATAALAGLATAAAAHFT